MQTDVDAKDRARTASLPEKRAGVEPPLKLIECPFVVSIDSVACDKFYDVRDAMASAREAQKKKLGYTVVITDARTGALVIEVEG